MKSYPFEKPLTFFDTYIDEGAYEKVAATLRSGRLSEGAQVQEFEMALAELGLAYPVAVNSGTSALHLALVLAGVEAGDEVILPAQTFVASGTVIVQQGAVPVFADIQPRTGNIDPQSVRERLTARTKAIMPVHWGGLPVDLDEIHAIAHEHGLAVIEDAAHALGALYKGRAIGTISPYTCFSFQAIKHVTTGDGGAISFTDESVHRRARTGRWFGIDRDRSQPSPLGERLYDIGTLGFKYHLNDYGAALGLANLTTFPERLAKRRETVALYRERLAGISGITPFDAPSDRESAWWLFGTLVERREDFVRRMHEAHIPVSVVHQGIDRNSLFGGLRHDLVHQRAFDEQQIHLPLHDRIGTDEVEYITDVIKEGW